MQTIVIVSGYARSGKSTFLEIAEELGFVTVSTSQMLHDFIQRLFRQLFKIDIDTKTKGIKHFFNLEYNNEKQLTISRCIRGICSRTLLVDTAEKCIVPVFGREIFGVAAAKQAADNPLVVYEAFNKQECDLFLKHVGSIQNVTVVTVRRPSQKSLDDRELLHDYYAFAHNLIIDNDSSLEHYDNVVRGILMHVKNRQIARQSGLNPIKNSDRKRLKYCSSASS